VNAFECILYAEDPSAKTTTVVSTLTLCRSSRIIDQRPARHPSNEKGTGEAAGVEPSGSGGVRVCRIRKGWTPNPPYHEPTATTATPLYRLRYALLACNTYIYICTRVAVAANNSATKQQPPPRHVSSSTAVAQ